MAGRRKARVAVMISKRLFCIDSRLRGNDGGMCGNDGGMCGNDEEEERVIWWKSWIFMVC